MNIQQLEYLLAVNEIRHFAKAAEHCHVTQPTLSMMLRKLEEELGITLFDRSRQPVVPTREGEEVIRRARQILAEVKSLKGYAKELRGEIEGEMRLGIIPTLAPYLLPLFIRDFAAKHPALQIQVRDMTTADSLRALRRGELDLAILSTPLDEDDLEEHILFQEEFLVYASVHEKLPRKKYLLPAELDPEKLWILEEGHCMRGQVLNLCELRNAADHAGLRYEAGSILTLINLVDQQRGITIIPRLAAMRLNKQQQNNLRLFQRPTPVREISIVSRPNFPRQKLLKELRESILSSLPEEIKA